MLVAAAERRWWTGPLGLLGEREVRPAALTVACHELTRLVGRALPAQRAVWAHRQTARICSWDGASSGPAARSSRPGSNARAGEPRSLGLARWNGCDAVWISGDDAGRWLADLAWTLGVPVSAPPYAAAAAGSSALPASKRGRLLALARRGPAHPALNLFPEARPERLSRAQRVTVGMVRRRARARPGAAHDVRATRRAADARTAGSSPRRRRSSLVAELAQKRRILSALKGVRRRLLPPLPLMRELTELMPQDAWLSTLNLDAKTVEISGQAGAASQLIPLLESSARLERVEFTSPVTKTQNKGAVPHPGLLESRPAAGRGEHAQPQPSRSGWWSAWARSSR